MHQPTSFCVAMQASPVLQHYTAVWAPSKIAIEVGIEQIWRIKTPRQRHRPHIESHLKTEVEIRERYKCIREPSSPPWNSMLVAPKGAQRTVHNCPDRFSGIALHVVQRSFWVLDAMEVTPVHRCSMSGRKSEHRPGSGRKWEKPSRYPVKTIFNYCLTARRSGPQKHTIPTDANSLIFGKKKKQPSNDLSNLTAY